MKGGDPLGRIVHDYGYHPRDSYSVNSTHSCTSVKYLTLPEITKILDEVTWFIKADLENGYRQFGVHPVDWRFQVYCNGPDEHYIDLACPFGKTNSALEFCPPAKLFAESVAFWYNKQFSAAAPVLGTHVDDLFGGFKKCRNYNRAAHFRDFLIELGYSLTFVFNPKPSKTPLPDKSQVILGRRFNSITKRVSTAEKKRKKYRLRILELLTTGKTTRKELERIHGCLNYAVGVEPFGRPFLANLTMEMTGVEDGELVVLSPLTRLSLKIWDQILKKNKGISMDFILNMIPKAPADIFVDASTS